MDDWFSRMMDRADKHHEQMDAEFCRLAVEPSAKRPGIGDRVLLAVGLLNMGHLWMREEATVLECGDTSFRVQFRDRKEYSTNAPMERWVHQAIITDVLASERASPAGEGGGG